MDHREADQRYVEYMEDEWQPKSGLENMYGIFANGGFKVKAGSRPIHKLQKLTYPWQKELPSAVSDPLKPSTEGKGGFKSINKLDNNMSKNNSKITRGRQNYGYRVNSLVSRSAASGIDPGVMPGNWTDRERKLAQNLLYHNAGSNSGRRSNNNRHGRSRTAKNSSQRGRGRGRGGFRPSNFRRAYNPRQWDSNNGRSRGDGQTTDGSKIEVKGKTGDSFIPRGLDSKGHNVVEIRAYANSIIYKATTGKVSWLLNGATDIGGQWYALINGAYFLSSSTPIVTLANAYEDWSLTGSVEFVPCISAYSNPDIRLTALVTTAVDLAEGSGPSQFVGSPATPASTDTLIKSVVMSNPNSCSKPGWVEGGIVCKFPNPVWRKVAGPNSGATAVYDYTQTIANYRQCIPFALFVNISGAIPGADLTTHDVFFNLKFRFRGQRAAAQKAITYNLNTDEIAYLRKQFQDYKLSESRANTPARSIASLSLRTTRPITDREFVDVLDDDLLEAKVNTNYTPVNTKKSSSTGTTGSRK